MSKRSFKGRDDNGRSGWCDSGQGRVIRMTWRSSQHKKGDPAADVTMPTPRPGRSHRSYASFTGRDVTAGSDDAQFRSCATVSGACMSVTGALVNDCFRWNGIRRR